MGNQSPEAYIVGALRTAGGRKNGRLAKVHPADLAGKVLDGLMAQVRLDPVHVDDVILGCVSQNGAQAANIGRNAVLSSKFPESVPGTSVDRQCGSGQQALHFAAQGVLSGTQELVIGGGVENMSQVPIGSNIIDGLKQGHGQPWNGEAIKARYPGVQFSQFAGAELLAKQHGLTRDQLDEFAFESHQRAARATREGRFAEQILSLEVTLEVDGKPTQLTHAVDEGIRFDAALDKLRALAPLAPGGIITAGTSSQICDGAAAVLVASERALREHNLAPRARIHTLTVVGSDPIVMLDGPIPAAKKALARAGLRISDIDLYEVNEAFASVPLAFCKALNADPSKLNVNGGALALGHPLGATGAKLITTLLCELERTRGKYGLLAICEGGGTANCTIIERL